jgi:hypothetical protein
MPLALPALKQGLERTFAGPGATAPLCAQGWADAVSAYTAAIVPPSTTVTAAALALSGALGTAFLAPNAVPSMEAAFAAFGAAVGLGMASFAPIPPAGPVGFASLFSAAQPATHAEAAARIGDAIHTWLTTGTSTLLIPPGSPPVTWS